MPEDAASRRSVSKTRRFLAMAALVVCVSIIGTIWLTGTHFFLVPSQSMLPTLLPGDYIIAIEMEEYQRGDIVVFRDPDDDRETLVKRIVGMPGDTIKVYGGAVFLNDRYASEPYRHSPIDYIMEAYTVPEGEYFLMGDNSNASIDSHNWGEMVVESATGEEVIKGKPRSIPGDRLIGRVVRVYLPWSRQREVRRYPLRGIVEFGASQSPVKPRYNDGV